MQTHFLFKNDVVTNLSRFKYMVPWLHTVIITHAFCLCIGRACIIFPFLFFHPLKNDHLPFFLSFSLPLVVAYWSRKNELVSFFTFRFHRHVTHTLLVIMYHYCFFQTLKVTKLQEVTEMEPKHLRIFTTV